jgi:hypothetical protein
MVVEITGNPKAIMQYVNYEEDIILCYGVVLEGWTHEKFVNPSELSSALPPLQKLMEALKAGTCKFVKLSSAKQKKREAERKKKLASGKLQPCKRKTRKDVGKKRKSHHNKENEGSNSNGSSSDENDENHLQKHLRHNAKSATIVDSDDDDSQVGVVLHSCSTCRLSDHLDSIL